MASVLGSLVSLRSTLSPHVVGLRRTVAAAIGLFILVVASNEVYGQAGSTNIDEYEFSSFVGVLFSGLQRGDTDWFASQALPYAMVRYIHADGTQDAFVIVEDPSKFHKYWRPYQAIKWDRSAAQYSMRGSRASVRWRLDWSGYAGDIGDHPIQLVIDNWVDVVKDGMILRISDSGWQMYEQLPGAEHQFWRAVGGPADGGSGLYQRMTERLRQVGSWWKSRMHDDRDR